MFRLLLTLLFLARLFFSMSAQHIQHTTEVFGAEEAAKIEEAYRIIELSDGNFVVAGSWQQQAFLMKLTPCGDSLWFTTFKKGNTNDFRDVIELPSGNLLATGACSSCFGKENVYVAYLVEFDGNGNWVNETKINGRWVWSYGISLALWKNGDIAVGGVQSDSTTRYFLSRFLPDLTADTSLLFKNGIVDWTNRIMATPDGGMAIFGQVLDTVAGVSKWDAHVIKLNQQSSVLWEKRVRTRSLGFLPFGGADVMSDGTIIFASMIQTKKNATTDDLAVIRLDGNFGVVLDSLTYGSSIFNDQGYDVKVTEGDYVLVSGQYAGRESWVLRFNSQMELQESYRNKHGDYTVQPYCILPLNRDGSHFIFTGNRRKGDFGDVSWHRRTVAGNHLVLDEYPQDKQLYTRDFLTNKASVPLSGKLIRASNPYSQLIWRIRRNGQLLHTETIPVSGSDDTLDVQFQYDITAEMADYSFELVGFDGNFETVELNSCGLVAGDAMLIHGGPNARAERHEGDADQHKSQKVRTWAPSEINPSRKHWQTASGNPVSGGVGQWAVRMGQQITAASGIPLALINEGGFDGIIKDFSPQNQSYKKWKREIDKQIGNDKIRAIVWYQGEKDAGIGTSLLDYKNAFFELDSAWKADFPSMEKGYMFQIQAGCFQSVEGTESIQKAQTQLANELTHWELMSTTGGAKATDGCKLIYESGYEVLGRSMGRLIADQLYGLSDPTDLYPLRPQKAYWINDNTLRIDLADDPVELNWTVGAEEGFVLKGDPDASIIAGAIVGKSIILLTDADPHKLTAISYVGHPGPYHAAITNSQGIGLLGFSNLPIANSAITGIEDQLAENIILFPNPADKIMHLQWDETISVKDIVLRNTTGQALWRKSPDYSANELQIDLQNWPSGIYLMELITGQGRVWKKVQVGGR